MAKQQVAAFVHYERDYNNKPIFSVYPFDMTTTGKVLIGEQSIDVDVPDDFNPVAAQVDLLRKERARVSGEHADRLAAIDTQISKLTCIEHSPAEVV